MPVRLIGRWHIYAKVLNERNLGTKKVRLEFHSKRAVDNQPRPSRACIDLHGVNLHADGRRIGGAMLVSSTAGRETQAVPGPPPSRRGHTEHACRLFQFAINRHQVTLLHLLCDPGVNVSAMSRKAIANGAIHITAHAAQQTSRGGPGTPLNRRRWECLIKACQHRHGGLALTGAADSEGAPLQGTRNARVDGVLPDLIQMANRVRQLSLIDHTPGISGQMLHDSGIGWPSGTLSTVDKAFLDGRNWIGQAASDQRTAGQQEQYEGWPDNQELLSKMFGCEGARSCLGVRWSLIYQLAAPAELGDLRRSCTT